MKLVGKYSVASGLRWCLGFINVFVMIAACFMAFATFLSLFVPDLATGFLDNLNAAREDPSRNLELVERLTMLGAFLACGFTWWVTGCAPYCCRSIVATPSNAPTSNAFKPSALACWASS